MSDIWGRMELLVHYASHVYQPPEATIIFNIYDKCTRRLTSPLNFFTLCLVSEKQNLVTFDLLVYKYVLRTLMNYQSAIHTGWLTFACLLVLRSVDLLPLPFLPLFWTVYCIVATVSQRPNPGPVFKSFSQVCCWSNIRYQRFANLSLFPDIAALPHSVH